MHRQRVGSFDKMQNAIFIACQKHTYAFNLKYTENSLVPFGAKDLLSEQEKKIQDLCMSNFQEALITYNWNTGF